MIRFTWMQSRTPMLAGVAGLVIVALVVGITGSHLAHLYAMTIANCQASADCPAARSAFLDNDRALQIVLGDLVVVVPGIVGLFWGAPLAAREFETGTWRLAWTQSLTRTRWLAVRLIVLGLASVLFSGLLTFMVTWWSGPVDQASMARYASFGQRDLVPLGYAAFAFMLAVAAGVLIRRVLPALALALAAFVSARLAVSHWVRPHLITPAHQAFAITYASAASGDWSYGSNTGLLGSSGPATLLPPAPAIPNAWLYSTQIVDKAGHALIPAMVAHACPLLGAGGRSGDGGGSGAGGGATRIHAQSGQALQDCVTKIGAAYHEVVTYQPPGHYWPLQWYELAIYVGAALVLGGFSLWWVRNRVD